MNQTSSNGVSDLEGKWALITGASRGIGKAIAERLAEEGVNLALHYRSDLALAERVAADCRGKGVETRLFQADLSDPEGPGRLSREVLSDGFGVQILVNNAGMVETSPFWSYDEEVWERIQRVNLDGARHLIRAFLEPMLRGRWGRIINVSSILAEWGGRGNSAYSVSKAGLNALTRSVALEVARKGITVNAVAPGLVLTDMAASLGVDVQEMIIDRIPLRRAAEGREVAEAVVFLARCGYVTGEIIHLDGGLRHAV